MHKNGLVKFIAILFALISLLQISYTYVVNKIEKDAENYSITKVDIDDEDYVIKREQLQRSYLDSVSTISVFGFTNYKDAKEKELNKGLDLKGGINVILQISVKDILKGLAENTNDPNFNKALDNADELQKSSNDTYLEIFLNAFEEIEGSQLASPDVFANRTLSDEINFEMSNDEVKPIIRRKIDESITSAFEVLRKRIDKFGVTQPNIQRLGNSGRILVELPGAKDVDRVKKLLQSTAQLEFWTSEKNQEYFTFLSQANQVIKANLDEEIIKESVSSESSQIDDLLADVEVKSDSLSIEKNPLLDLIIGTGFQGGPVLAQFNFRDKDKVDSYINLPEVRQLLPSSPTLQAHVVCSILAYSLITISSLQALLIELQIRQLKFKSQNKIVSSLPSLEIMEKLLFRIIFLSEVLLSISLVSGFFFYDNLHEQKLLHKVALSSMAWLCFAILLSGRLLKGWRGPLAIRLTWISFICLALGFVGTKFVLEYILKI